MEKEILEEAAKRTYQKGLQDDIDLSFYDGVRFGAKWQAKRMYSEEDMINFANFKINNLMKHVDKTGFYLGTNKVLEIWKEEFKKK
jgi:hypothetical protein